MLTRRELIPEILRAVRECGPISRSELWDILEKKLVSKRTFYRAINDLINYGILGENNHGKVYLVGLEYPKEMTVEVGPRTLRINIPLKTELAQKILNRHPLLKRLIKRRKGPAYLILKDLGVIED